MFRIHPTPHERDTTRIACASSESGFSFVELMVTIAILGILAAIAVPSYSEHIMRSRRTDAINALNDLALRLEQRYTDINAYAGATIATDPATDVLASANSPEGFYTLAINAVAATTFSVTATPTGAQASDTLCGSYTLDHLGTRSVSGTGGQQNCW